MRGSRGQGHYMDNRGNSRTKWGQEARGITWIAVVILERNRGEQGCQGVVFLHPQIGRY